jgi:hypothetical protein
VTKTWDDQTKTLTLVCNHTQAGAINFRIQGDTISGIQITKNNDVSMSIFPNPCKNDVLLKYQFKNSGKFSVTFYDMMGKKIQEPIINEAHSNGEKQYSVDFSNLKQGQYICKTTFSDKSSIQKIITKL